MHEGRRRNFQGSTMIIFLFYLQMYQFHVSCYRGKSVKLMNHVKSALLSLAVFGSVSTSSTHAEVPAGYQMIFSDEFSSTRIDPEKWITTMHFAGTQGERFHNIAYLNYNLD